MSSPRKILFAANDPGGAQAIAPVIAELLRQGDECGGIATGPAQEIFSRTRVPFQAGGSLSDEALDKWVDAFEPSVFLAARSVDDAAIDKRVLLRLREKDVPSIYVLDFWNYYTQWFSSPGTKDLFYLPDIICVMDERARDDMIKEGFPAERLRITGNPHFDHFADGISRGNENKHQILFISQPISENMAEHSFTEFDALRDIVELLRDSPEYSLSIRLHPKERVDKYNDYLSATVQISKNETLEAALSEAGCVIGMFSPVLMQAAIAGKPTISYQPNLKANDPLPTNALGITKLACSPEELRQWLSVYKGGAFPSAETSVMQLFPKGATVRVIAVLDTLFPER